MAKIDELFDKYSEEFIGNSIKGKVRAQDIQDISALLPLDIELIAIDNDGLLFQSKVGTKTPTLRITPEANIDTFSFEVVPQISGLFRLMSYDKENETGSINYLPCGRGQGFKEDITIGYSPNYIVSRRAKSIDRLPDELYKALVFESNLGCYLLEEIYPDKTDNKTLHGLMFAADLVIKDQKYILDKSRRKNIGSIDDFCRYRLIRYPSIDFVEENNAKAIMERIQDKATQGKALLNIWTEYSNKELEKAEQLSGLFGEIQYTDGKDMTNHVKLLKLNFSKEQARALKEHENDFKNSSFEKAETAGMSVSETYKIRSIKKKYNLYYAEVIDENDTLRSSGTLVLSVKGDIHVNQRREKAYQHLCGGRITAILRNLLFAIEDEAAEMIDLYHEGHKKALTDRTRAFLQKRFGISDLTDNQKKAVEIALNTPDIAVIQGPPGTGKSTVIAVICDRLFEEAEKEAKKNKHKDQYDSSKLILASAFQNDTVEHIASKIEDMGLPTVKIGKDSTTISAEQIVANNMIKAIDNALQYYASRSVTSRLSSRVKKIKDVYIKEHNLVELKRNIDFILLSLDLTDELWKQWKSLSKPFGSRDNMKDDKRVKALKKLSTDAVSYDDSGFQEVQKLLRSGLVFTDEERSMLEDAPVDEPTEEFLQFLVSVKEKYLSELDQASETSSEGNNESLMNWLDAVISYERQKEENAYDDPDTFITANLESLRGELEGESLYIRDSILEYSESVAATNQKAGSKDMPAKFQNVILEEAARSNPLDLLIPMTRALRRIILVGDQKQLPQLIENDIVEDVVSEKFEDLAERDIARKKYESSLFGVLYKNLGKASKKRMIRLNEQFRMHPAIGNFISSLYYDNEVKAGMKDQELKKSHGLTVNGLKGKVMVFCDVSHEQGYEKKGIGKSRECEAKRVMSLVKDIMSDPGGKDLSIGVITFYAAQRDLIFEEAEKMGFANRLPSGDYEIDDSVKATRDGREKFRIGTVDSFQGKEFDVVILSATRSNTIERKEGNVRKVFGFLTSENRLNVAFSRAQRLLIVCGDSEMFKDEYAQTYVNGLYEFYVNQSTDKNYGARII